VRQALGGSTDQLLAIDENEISGERAVVDVRHAFHRVTQANTLNNRLCGTKRNKTEYENKKKRTKRLHGVLLLARPAGGEERPNSVP